MCGALTRQSHAFLISIWLPREQHGRLERLSQSVRSGATHIRGSSHSSPDSREGTAKGAAFLAAPQWDRALAQNWDEQPGIHTRKQVMVCLRILGVTCAVLCAWWRSRCLITLQQQGRGCITWLSYFWTLENADCSFQSIFYKTRNIKTWRKFPPFSTPHHLKP